jgi:hypothetical protein
MLSREDLTDLAWDPERDVFCAEVNPVRRHGGQDRASGERIPDTKLPEDTAAKAGYCSELASRDGLGHTSLDLLRSPNGDSQVVELNTQEVAIWWTSKFETVRRNHAAAIHSLVRGNSALGG